MTDTIEPAPRPRYARRAMAAGALSGLLYLAYKVPMVTDLKDSQADVLIALTYSLMLVITGYMGVQIAPEVFKRK